MVDDRDSATAPGADGAAVRWVSMLPYRTVSPLAFRALLLLAVRTDAGSTELLSVAQASALFGCSYNHAGLALAELHSAGYVHGQTSASSRRGRRRMHYAMRWPPEPATGDA